MAGMAAAKLVSHLLGEYLEDMDEIMVDVLSGCVASSPTAGHLRSP